MHTSTVEGKDRIFSSTQLLQFAVCNVTGELQIILYCRVYSQEEFVYKVA